MGLAMQGLRKLGRALACAWAAPCSAVGLLCGLLALLSGARMQIRLGALEFGGGRFGRWVSRLPPPVNFSAITFGHVILGTDLATLDAVRAHEQVHVRQYERWGLLFFPAYLLSSLVQFVRRRDPYFDNHFEREAYAKSSPGPACRHADAAARKASPPIQP
jgi:hypothetical protein